MGLSDWRGHWLCWMLTGRNNSSMWRTHTRHTIYLYTQYKTRKETRTLLTDSFAVDIIWKIGDLGAPKNGGWGRSVYSRSQDISKGASLGVCIFPVVYVEHRRLCIMVCSFACCTRSSFYPPPSNIQHNQCPCRFSNPKEDMYKALWSQNWDTVAEMLSAVVRCNAASTADDANVLVPKSESTLTPSV